MNFIICIIVIAIAIIACICFSIVYKDDDILHNTAIIIIIALAICIGGIIECYHRSYEPSAIDVYRGNTTLEIKEITRDSVVIERDTIVIFKNKSYENHH